MLAALLANWKILVAVGGALALFGTGWTVNGWKHDAAMKRAETAHQQDVREAQAKVFAEWDEQRKKDDARRTALTKDLNRLKVVNSRLQTEVSDAQLVKPITVVEERWRETGCEAPVLANPFTADFARLFNQSANRYAGGLSEADSEG